MGYVFGHLSGVLVEQGVMLDENNRMSCLFQNGHELEYCECPTDFQLLESAIQLAEDTRMITADVKHFVTLQVQVTVQGLDEKLSRGL